MISLSSILTAIKGATLATKIGLCVAATAVVVGGTAGTVAIINYASNRTTEEQQVVSNNPNDDNSPIDEKKTEAGETGEAEDDDEKTEQVADDKQANSNISSGSQNTQKPSNNTSSKPSNNTSSSKPATQPSKPSQPASPSQPSQPTQPSKPTEPVKRPDYNLNDKYVAGYETYPFYIYDASKPDFQQCVLVEEKSYFAVTKFTGSTGALMGATMPKALEYARSKGYATECWGAGAGQMSWQDAISQGIALDEVKCAQYGLSCGRW